MGSSIEVNITTSELNRTMRVIMPHCSTNNDSMLCMDCVARLEQSVQLSVS